MYDVCKNCKGCGGLHCLVEGSPSYLGFCGEYPGTGPYEDDEDEEGGDE